MAATDTNIRVKRGYTYDKSSQLFFLYTSAGACTSFAKRAKTSSSSKAQTKRTWVMTMVPHGPHTGYIRATRRERNTKQSYHGSLSYAMLTKNDKIGIPYSDYECVQPVSQRPTGVGQHLCHRTVCDTTTQQFSRRRPSRTTNSKSRVVR